MERIVEKVRIFNRKRRPWAAVQVEKTSKWALIKVKVVLPNQIEMCQDLELEDWERLLEHNPIKSPQEDRATSDSQGGKNNWVRKDYPE